MFATLPLIIQTVLSIAGAAKTLIDLGRDVSPQLADLKKLLSGDKITMAELQEMRARNDALNAEIEALAPQPGDIPAT